jgi:hypothetical protein
MRLSILKRDNFTCKICHTNVKDNKSLRLEVHHAKAFNDICKENNVSTVEQALACEELWDLNNGFSICYRCHKDRGRVMFNAWYYLFVFVSWCLGSSAW